MSDSDRGAGGFAGLPIGWAVSLRALGVAGLAALGPQLAPPGGAGLALSLGIAIAGAALLGGWVSRRYGRPLRQACEAATRHRHRRTDPPLPEAAALEPRRVAIAIHALMQASDRQHEAGRATGAADIQAAAAELRALGEGDLEAQSHPLEEPFTPLSDALDASRRALRSRVRQLSTRAGEAALSLSQLSTTLPQLRLISHETHGALVRLDRGVADAVEELAAAQAAMKEAAEQLFLASAERRRVSREARATVPRLSRRAEELSDAAARAGALLRDAGVMEQALGLLAEQSHGGEPPRPERVLPILREARAAQNKLRQELSELEAALRGVSSALNRATRDLPEPPPDLESELSVPLFEVAAASRRGLELCQSELALIGAGAKEAAKLSGGLAEVEEQAQRLQPDLVGAFAAIRIGQDFQQGLLQRLEAAAQANAAPPGQLSPDTQAVLTEVEATAHRARARIDRLADATEGAIQALGRPLS